MGGAIENAKKDTLLLGGEKCQSFPEKSYVNQKNRYDRTPTVSNAKTKSCLGCERDGHVANHNKCRAKGAECKECTKIGHYVKYCRSSGAEKEKRKVKVVHVQYACQDRDEYHHEYVYFTSKEGRLDLD